jgi:hypothetical protein
LNLYAKGKRLSGCGRSHRLVAGPRPGKSRADAGRTLPIFGSTVWERLSDAERANTRRHFQAWQLSQFLHGEQGALVCTAKIVQQVPDIDAKFYAATQVIDEARHVEAYSRLCTTSSSSSIRSTRPEARSSTDVSRLALGLHLPRHAGADRGVALAAFAAIRDSSQNPLAASVNAYVMQDEARHVAFGRLALRDYYPQLTRRSATSARSSPSRGAGCCATASSAKRCGRRSAIL